MDSYIEDKELMLYQHINDKVLDKLIIQTIRSSADVMEQCKNQNLTYKEKNVI